MAENPEPRNEAAMAPTAKAASRQKSGDVSSLFRLLVITILIFVVMSLLRPDLFFTVRNFSSMAFQFPEIALLALAIMVAMLTGGIDLSIIGTANLSAILAALVLSNYGVDVSGGWETAALILIAILLSLGTGLVCGLVNGFCIAGIGIPPILATLGTGLIFTGIGIVLTGGSAVVGFPEAFSVIGNGTILQVPVPLIIFAVLAIILAVMLNRTAFGIEVYMMGTNPLASRFAGIDNAAVTLKTYLISAFLAANAGLVMMSRANSAKADYGSSYLLLSVLIAVLGGINPYGGFGRVAGLVLAVLSLQFLSSGLSMLQVSNFAKEFIWGALLLLVLVVNTLQLNRLSKA